MTAPVTTAGPADPNASTRVKTYTVLTGLLGLIPILTVFKVITTDQGVAVGNAAQALIGLAGAFGFAFVATKTKKQVDNGTFEAAPANPVNDAFDALNQIKDHVDATVFHAQDQVGQAVQAITGAVSMLPGGAAVSAAVTSGPVGDLIQSISDHHQPSLFTENG
jgi:hypothetical protein